MRHLALLTVPALVLSSLSYMACGDGGSGGSGASGSSSSGTCPDNLAPAANSEFCANDTTPTDCERLSAAYKDQVCGVGVIAPLDELKRSDAVKEFAGSGPPDVACFTPAGYPTAGASQTVKIKGLAKIFSHGCQSKDLEIQVFLVDQTPNGVELGQQVGATVTTPPDCTDPADGEASVEDDCGMRYECFYEYDGVPTETEIVILTKGMEWSPLYDFNQYIPNSEVVNGVWDHNVRALAKDDYQVIPQVAIGSPITLGHGAIAGEVHDCGDVRLIGATVDVSVARKIVTYFTNDEDHPLPDLGKSSTTSLGLYAALDVEPGQATVAAMGLVNGSVVTLGYHRVKVFPESVTSVTFRGLRPYQVP